MKLHGEGAFNPGKTPIRTGDGAQWDDPPHLAAKVGRLTTGGQDRWRGNYPAYVLERWGGRLPAGGLRALVLAGSRTARTVEWFAAIERVEEVVLLRDPEDAGTIDPDVRSVSVGVREEVWTDLARLGEFHLVVADYALSRLPNLEASLDALRRVLARGGVLAIRDYCGANRFQFSNAQMRLVNALLPLLPEKRRQDIAGQTKDSQDVPPLAWVINNDPRAAINSQELRLAASRRFAVVEEADLGGTLLMPLLAGISHNFGDDSEEGERLLDVAWAVEHDLIDAGMLPSDHWFAVLDASVEPRPEPDEGQFIDRADVLGRTVAKKTIAE